MENDALQQISELKQGDEFVETATEKVWRFHHYDSEHRLYVLSRNDEYEKLSTWLPLWMFAERFTRK